MDPAGFFFSFFEVIQEGIDVILADIKSSYAVIR
jgi:hypothetical protein